MTRSRALDDNKLLDRIAAGDRGAFETLYRSYYRRLFGYIFKVIRRADLVEEVVNDVLFVVWQSADRFDGRSKPSSWILGIAYRKALKALAKQGRRDSKPDARDLEPAPIEGPESLMVRREQAGLLGQALAELSPEQRAVVELTYFHELSYPEIAKIVDCPTNTVKTRMFHARRRLRSVLPGFGVSKGHIR